MATDKIRQARASAPANEDILRTLELSHPLWPATRYLTNYTSPFTATLETGLTVTYTPFPFAVILPTVDGGGHQDMQVTLTNADREIYDLIKLAHADPTNRIQCLYREFLSDATDAPQSAPLRLSFDTIQAGEESVTGVAGRSDVLNRRFPGIWYDPQKFPGLDR